VWNVDNSTDVSYITISSKTGISELDISGGVDYYIRTDADDITPYYTPTITDSSNSVIDTERPDIVDFHERRCAVEFHGFISKYDRRIRKRYCRVVDHDIRG
jgi:hypothetical protein